jgi:hypothetical protein
MISPEKRAQIRLYFYAKHWKVGTIAREPRMRPDAVRNAIARRGVTAQVVQPFLVDFLLAFANAIAIPLHHGKVGAARRRKK